MTHRIIVVCQARTGSTRLPRKVMLPLEGKPLIIRFMERVMRSKLATQCVVAATTDPADDLLVATCLEHGIPVFQGHPTDLLDRHYRAGIAYSADVVVKVPSDCPLIDPVVIDRIIGNYLASPADVDYVGNLHPATYPDGNDVELMTMSALERAWHGAHRAHEREHTTPWMWDGNPDVRVRNVMWERGLDYSMSHRWTIDYPEDYMLVKAVYHELFPTNPQFSIDDVLDLLERRPEILALNAHLAGVNWYREHLDVLRTISQEHTRPAPIQRSHI